MHFTQWCRGPCSFVVLISTSSQAPSQPSHRECVLPRAETVSQLRKCWWFSWGTCVQLSFLNQSAAVAVAKVKECLPSLLKNKPITY